MDRRERSNNPIAALMSALDGKQSEIWTAFPAIVTGFNAAQRTVTLQPALQALVQAPDGSKAWVTLPLLVDCPVFFPGGGGVVLTFPLKSGDECLAIIACRCIDAWWQSGCPLSAGGLPTAQVQAELRMHDLSDGFCFAGVASLPKVQPGISVTTAQLRNDAGTTYVEVDPAGNVNVLAPVAITLTAPIINSVGVWNHAGTLTATGDVIASGKSLKNHVHGGVVPGGGTTGAPV